MSSTEHIVTQGGAVVYNPTAGRGQGGLLRAQAQQMLGNKFEWIPTQKAGHARQLAEEAARRHEVVVALGGDGTVGDVARGILAAGTDAVLGILPVGTGNDFARNLGLRLELNEAVATILGGVVRRIDVGTVNGTPFINNCGTGFDARVMQTMNTSIRFTRGKPAFYLAILKTAPAFKPFTLTICADDAEPVVEKAMMVSILNGKVYGAGMMAAPRADMDDGLLDVMVIRAMGKAKLLGEVFPKVVNGQHENHPAVRAFQARKLRIDTVPGHPLNIDGDVTGMTPMEVAVLPRALKVLVR